MKKTINIIIMSLSTSIAVYLQCDVNVEDIMNQFCEGEYLTHQVIDNRNDSVFSVIMEKNRRYAIYILNPSNKLPDFTLIRSNQGHIKDYNYTTSKDQNYCVYSIITSTEDPVSFRYKFHIDDYACALLALYYQNIDKYKPGLYNTFESFKSENPSTDLPSGITSDVKKLGLGKGAQEITYYRLDISREDAKKYDKVFGFSDGQKFYINFLDRKVKPGTDFVELEPIGEYGYFEYISYMVVTSGTATTTTPYLEQSVMDLNTGETKLLRKNSLREIISADKELLEQFNNEKRKSKKLKDYLYKYEKRNN
jgi:hypothetical protein